MTQSLMWVAGFVLLLALVPFGIKWVQSRSGMGAMHAGASSRVVSAVAVGPQQRVVTVEVGPSDARICLVLGVTQQSIACLHTFPSDGAPSSIMRTPELGAQSPPGSTSL
jgi:flagellar protein FliO/FliZ